jgi:hypothetical protein
MVAGAGRHTDPAEMLVECLAFTLERLPKERYLSLLVVPDRRASFTRNITSATGFDLTSTLLSRLPVDWAALGVGKPQREAIVEIWLRTLQSFALDPGPARTRRELRAFLRLWMAPAIDSVSEQSAARAG